MHAYFAPGNEPVSDVLITIGGSADKTDENGEIRFLNLSEGEYLVEIFWLYTTNDIPVGCDPERIAINSQDAVVLPMGNLYMVSGNASVTSSEGGVAIGTGDTIMLSAGDNATLNLEFSCKQDTTLRWANEGWPENN